eukprot:Unigene3870_Nuclearia_a/m.11807 Unigene3870_Nuclearia_a/g.11807  ORF Unigene3870_Nuclearia_a/g.11807 Unigene3870_Nuclearia_a/m.11807 type:complete len:124 (-) Unigene3870_Nuclearia_a:94-465(-)
MPITVQTVEEFYAFLRTNGILPTLNKYYAADAQLGEAGLPYCEGLPAIIEVESKFAGMLDPNGIFQEIKIHNIAVTNNVAAIEHVLTMKFGNGFVVQQPQVSIQHWNDEGKIVKETFYHVKKD